MWDAEPNRIALLELWASGTLRRRQSCAMAWDELARLPWTRRTTRRSELALVATRRPDLERLLDSCWPEWRDTAARLRGASRTLDAQGVRGLADQDRRERLPTTLRGDLNQRTVAAALADHSKAALRREQRDVVDPRRITRDGLIRLRPSPGMRVTRGDDGHDATALAELLGEVGLTERALRSGTRLAGPRPVAVLLVENVGAYVDLRPPPGWLVVHVPGWDTAMVRLLLAQLNDVPRAIFGDLDPNGVRIARHLRQHDPDLVWAVPELWRDYVKKHALRREWPPDFDLDGVPAIVRELAERGLWLEQETIVLDERLPAALVEVLARGAPVTPQT